MPPRKRAKRKVAAPQEGPARDRRATAGKTLRRTAASGREDRGKRLLDLVVMLLGARAPVPYREIRAQFQAYRTARDDAGLRAFERDKADLLELGVPLRYVTPEDDDTIEEAGYIVDLRRYRLPEIHLTPDEVGALVLAGSMASAAPGTTYADVVNLALKKLAFDLPAAPDTPGASPHPSAPVLVHFPRPKNAKELAETLSKLEQATRNRKRVTFDYINVTNAQAIPRKVDPYGLVYRQGSWLLVGHCHLRNGVRTFRLDRMSKVEVAPKPKSPDFERPANFDVRRYSDRSPWTFEIAPPLSVTLDVLPAASAVANEDFGEGAEREPLGDGAVRVRFTCRNPDYLVARVLAAKGGLVVVSPPELRARVRAEIEALLARYPS